MTELQKNEKNCTLGRFDTHDRERQTDRRTDIARTLLAWLFQVRETDGDCVF